MLKYNDNIVRSKTNRHIVIRKTNRQLASSCSRQVKWTKRLTWGNFGKKREGNRLSFSFSLPGLQWLHLPILYLCFPSIINCLFVYSLCVLIYCNQWLIFGCSFESEQLPGIDFVSLFSFLCFCLIVRVESWAEGCFT